MSEAAQIADLIARIAKIDPPAPDADIYRAGLESTDALELLLDMEDLFGVSIPDDQFITARTTAELTALVDRLGSA